MVIAPSMLVIVHDVTPKFASEIRIILRALKPHLGTQIAAAVVPDWKCGGSQFGPAHRDLLKQFGEILLHGWTHQRDCNPGFISALTDRADEFGGLHLEAIQNRIDIAQRSLFDETGQTAAGFLPPAWQLPVPSNQLRGLKYVVRYRRLESCDDRTSHQPLVTWSWDWGSLTCGAGFGELVPKVLSRLSPESMLCVAIHPMDVTSGWFSRAEKLIHSCLARGHSCRLPGDRVLNREAR